MHAGMYTANSMNCLSEALGIALPGNGTIPAVYSARTSLAKKRGNASNGIIKKKYKTFRYNNSRIF